MLWIIDNKGYLESTRSLFLLILFFLCDENCCCNWLITVLLSGCQTVLVELLVAMVSQRITAEELALLIRLFLEKTPPTVNRAVTHPSCPVSLCSGCWRWELTPFRFCSVESFPVALSSHTSTRSNQHMSLPLVPRLSLQLTLVCVKHVAPTYQQRPVINWNGEQTLLIMCLH